MKLCTKCNQTKTTDQFSVKSQKAGTLCSYCKLCNKEYQREHYKLNKQAYKDKARSYNYNYMRETRAKIFTYLETHPCVDCAESDPIVLDFDHLDPSTKSNNISEMVSNSCSWERIELEIAKCEVRCANCHRRRTAKQFNWYSYMPVSSNWD